MAGSLAMPLWFPWIFVEYDYVGLQQVLLAVQAAKQEAKKFSAHLLPCHKSLWHLALPQSALVCQLKSRNLQAIPFNEAPRSSGSGLAFWEGINRTLWSVQGKQRAWVQSANTSWNILNHCKGDQLDLCFHFLIHPFLYLLWNTRQLFPKSSSKEEYWQNKRFSGSFTGQVIPQPFSPLFFCSNWHLAPFH